MVYHAVEILPRTSSEAISKISQIFLSGNSGVAIFFVLSGYLLSSPFWKAWINGKERPSLKVFFIRRLARIAPPFWINIIICYALSSQVPGISAQLGIVRLLAGVTFISGFSWITMFPTNINAPLWSISFEITSYSIFAFGAFLFFRRNKARSIKEALKFWLSFGAFIIVIHVMILRFAHPNSEHVGWQYGPIGGAKSWWPEYNPIGFFLFFLVGVISSLVSENLKKSNSLATNINKHLVDVIVTLTLSMIAMLLMLMPNFRSPFWSIPPLPYLFPFFPGIAALLLIFIPLSSFWKRAFEARIFYFVSTLSYGLYLWHHFFLYVTPKFGCFSHINNEYEKWIAIVGISYLLSLFTAAVSWKLLEKPIISWAHKFR
jgi:peptidoglycan/LPS O-acetylase OafA/YrhL